MSTATTKVVVERFLKSDVPEVLVLKGAWGVGKTYAWNALINEFKGTVKPKNYCYVSLFGISSMQELRLAVFAKTKPVQLVNKKLDFETINKDWLRLTWSGGKGLISFIHRVRDAVPRGKEISVGLETVAPYFIGPTLVCLDDFERCEQVQPEVILSTFH